MDQNENYLEYPNCRLGIQYLLENSNITKQQLTVHLSKRHCFTYFISFNYYKTCEQSDMTAICRKGTPHLREVHVTQQVSDRGRFSLV